MKVFKKVLRDGDFEYFASNDLKMVEEEKEALEKQRWGIEAPHRGLKQYCGAERVQVKKAVAIFKHLLFLS